MKLTVFNETDPYQGPRMSGDALMRRLQKVVDHELTPTQREIFAAYFYNEKTIPQIACERGVNKSSVSRALHRAINRVRKCLKY